MEPAFRQDVCDLHEHARVPASELKELGVEEFVRKYTVELGYDLTLSADETEYILHEPFEILIPEEDWK